MNIKYLYYVVPIKVETVALLFSPVGLCTILCQKLIYENDGYYENGKLFHHTSGDDRTKLYCIV